MVSTTWVWVNTYRYSLLGEWTSIYQLFWCSPGVHGFDTLPHVSIRFCIPSNMARLAVACSQPLPSHLRRARFGRTGCAFKCRGGCGSTWGIQRKPCRNATLKPIHPCSLREKKEIRIWVQYFRGLKMLAIVWFPWKWPYGPWKNGGILGLWSPQVDEGFTSPRALSGGWLHQATQLVKKSQRHGDIMGTIYYRIWYDLL